MELKREISSCFVFTEKVFSGVWFLARVPIPSERIAIIVFTRIHRLTGASFCMLHPSSFVMQWRRKGMDKLKVRAVSSLMTPLFKKSNSGCEGCTKVHDHVSHKAVYGMKVLTAAYFDGLTTTVTDFSIQCELGKNGKGGLSNAEWEYQYSKKRPAQDSVTKRFNEIDKSKMEQVPEMIRRGVCHGLKIEYALFDSWFTCPKLINEIRSIGKQNIHVVALHKMDNQRFSVNGKLYHIQDLVALNERNARPCRNMKAVFFALRGEMGGIPVKMFFVRYGRQDKWRLLIKTLLFHSSKPLKSIRYAGQRRFSTKNAVNTCALENIKGLILME